MSHTRRQQRRTGSSSPAQTTWRRSLPLRRRALCQRCQCSMRGPQSGRRGCCLHKWPPQRMTPPMGTRMVPTLFPTPWRALGVSGTKAPPMQLCLSWDSQMGAVQKPCRCGRGRPPTKQRTELRSSCQVRPLSWQLLDGPGSSWPGSGGTTPCPREPSPPAPQALQASRTCTPRPGQTPCSASRRRRPCSRSTCPSAALRAAQPRSASSGAAAQPAGRRL